MNNNGTSQTWRPWEFNPPPTNPDQQQTGPSNYYGHNSPFRFSSDKQDVEAGSQQHQLPPSFGPTRTSRRSPKTEAKIHKQTHESLARMIPSDHSSGTHQGMAPMDAWYDPVVRDASRPLSRNPSQTGTDTIRHQWMLGPRTWRRTDRVNLSVEQIPIGDLQSIFIFQLILINLSINNPCAVSATSRRPDSPPSTSAGLLSTSLATSTNVESSTKINIEERTCNFSIAWKSSLTYICRTDQQGQAWYDLTRLRLTIERGILSVCDSFSSQCAWFSYHRSHPCVRFEVKRSLEDEMESREDGMAVLLLFSDFFSASQVVGSASSRLIHASVDSSQHTSWGLMSKKWQCCLMFAPLTKPQ